MRLPEFKLYRATNKLNGHAYIGMTKTSLAKRWSKHVWCALRGTGRGPLADAIRKYGAEAFEVEHIASAKSWDDMQLAEQDLILQEGTFGNGYNATAGGQGLRGYKRTAEHNARLVASYKARLARQGGCVLKGRPRGAAVSANLSIKMRGRVVSSETRAIMSAGQRKRVFTQAEKDRFKRDGDRRRASGRTLTDEQVGFIRNQRAEGVKFVDLAKFYGVSATVVQSAGNGLTYRHVPMPVWSINAAG